MAWLVCLIVAFLLLSGMMAAIDAAFLSVTRPEIEEMIHAGRRGAIRLLEAKRRITETVVVIVILTNTINVLGPILVSRQAFAVSEGRLIGIITGVLIVGSIVFSEILPKALGVHFAPLISRLSSPILRVTAFLMYPVVILLARLSELFMTGTRRIGTEQQIRALVEMGRRAGLIERDEGRMIHRVFVLNDRTAADIMTPRKDVIAFQQEDSIGKAADEVRQCVFSRYPVFDAKNEAFLGIVMSRDVLAAQVAGRQEDVLTTIIRPGLIVSCDTPSDQLLVLFRDRHIHLAAVKEEDSIVGIVTLEDVLEELVGEIEDEKDAFDRIEVSDTTFKP